jgi:hypothetical protein
VKKDVVPGRRGKRERVAEGPRCRAFTHDAVRIGVSERKREPCRIASERAHAPSAEEQTHDRVLQGEGVAFLKEGLRHPLSVHEQGTFADIGGVDGPVLSRDELQLTARDALVPEASSLASSARSLAKELEDIAPGLASVTPASEHLRTVEPRRFADAPRFIEGPGEAEGADFRRRLGTVSAPR